MTGPRLDELPHGVARRVEVDDNGCWLWTGSVVHNGYGQVAWNEATWRVHRLAYTILVGPIPEGLDLDHLCRVRRCCNPAHLEAVTRRENLLRGDTLMARQVAATHCPQGHPYDEANTYLSRGRRYCRECKREYDRMRVRKRNAA